MHGEYLYSCIHLRGKMESRVIDRVLVVFYLPLKYALPVFCIYVKQMCHFYTTSMKFLKHSQNTLIFSLCLLLKQDLLIKSNAF